MAKSGKSSKFGFGLFMGMVGGALAALFLSPGTGEQNRAKASKEIKKLKKSVTKARKIVSKVAKKTPRRK